MWRGVSCQVLAWVLNAKFINISVLAQTILEATTKFGSQLFQTLLVCKSGVLVLSHLW